MYNMLSMFKVIKYYLNIFIIRLSRIAVRDLIQELTPFMPEKQRSTAIPIHMQVLEIYFILKKIKNIIKSNAQKFTWIESNSIYF